MYVQKSCCTRPSRYKNDDHSPETNRQQCGPAKTGVFCSHLFLLWEAKINFWFLFCTLKEVFYISQLAGLIIRFISCFYFILYYWCVPFFRLFWLFEIGGTRGRPTLFCVGFYAVLYCRGQKNPPLVGFQALIFSSMQVLQPGRYASFSLPRVGVWVCFLWLLSWYLRCRGWKP